MAAINPYLTFNGNCEEAFNFYKSVFGGEFPFMGRFKDMPGDHAQESEGNKVMHVSLPIGNGTYLMGSDSMDSCQATFGTNISISINSDSSEEADRLYSGLSADGQATMPMDKVFWGAYFGMLTDKFGINWMINYDYGQNKKDEE